MKKKLSILKKAANQTVSKKRIAKGKPKQQIPIQDDEEIDSDFLSETPQEKPNKDRDFDLESDENAKEQDNIDSKRIQLAKKLLADTQTRVRKDEFFMGTLDLPEERKINEALQQQILGKRNLLFTQSAANIDVDRVPTSEWYKGHTQCITSVQFDPLGKHLYSVSKDRSIIKWDLESKKKTFISLGKDQDAHQGDIFCASLNYDGRMLATSGSDWSVKLWDTLANKLITTLKSHRAPVYALSFGLNSNNLCSVSCDRTMKLWDAGERAYIDTFFGHRAEVIDMDASGQDSFVSCGFDRQAIVWKTKFGSQLIFNGHDYSIDCVRSLTPDFFVTGSQDASIGLWSLNKKRPIYMLPNAHGQGNWITALGGTHNNDLFASGSYNQKINLYKFDPTRRTFDVLHHLPSNGIINKLAFNSNQQLLASVESDEHRLGRWITRKAKNQVVVYKLW